MYVSGLIADFHNQKGKFTCDTCFRTYKRKETLLRHKKLECGVDPQFHCPDCQFRTKRRDSLKVHWHTKHRLSELNQILH